MGEWVETKLGNVLSFLTKGTTPNQKMGGFSTVGVNYIKSDAVSYDGRINPSLFVKVSEEVHNSLRRSQLKAGDVLFSMAGAYMGKTGVVSSEMLPANTNQAVAILRADRGKITVKFLSYYLRLSSTIEYVNNLSGQSAQPNINFEEIKSLEILLPPLPEQKAIAEVLSSLDDKIDLLHRQNKTLESLAETLFRQYFIENAQDDWEEVPLKEICVIRNGYAFKSETYVISGQKIIRTLNFNNGNVDLNSLVYITDELAKSYSNFELRKKDFLLVMVGASLGNFAIVTSEILPALQNQNMWCFRALNENHQNYLNHALRGIIADNLHGASGSARSFFQKGAFYELPIKVPDKETLRIFDIASDDIFNKVEANRKQIGELETLRDTLLPKLMNGDVRVEV